MSWSGFKKALNRGGTHVLIKTGYIDTTIDKQFDRLEGEFKAMEKESLLLQKNVRNYLDYFRQVFKSQADLIESFKIINLDNNNDFLEELSNLMNNELINNLKDFDQEFRITVHQPIFKFNNNFIEVNEAINKREKKKLDYDLLKSKVKKLEDKVTYKSSYNNNIKDNEIQLNKLKNNLNDSKLVYNNLNEQLKNDLPKLLKSKLPYFNATFESFIKLQLKYFNNQYIKFNNLQNFLDIDSREIYASGDLNDQIDEILSRMGQLNITNDHLLMDF